MKVLRIEVLDRQDAGGFMGIMDDLFCSSFNVTPEEMDSISAEMSDEEMSIFADKAKTFSHKRKQLEIRNKYVDYYKEKYGSNK